MALTPGTPLGNYEIPAAQAPGGMAGPEVGMLNPTGLRNPGRERFLAEVLPRLAELGIPVWVSVGGFAAEEYAATCAALDARDEVECIELNLSCPNVDEAPESAAEIVAACRGVTTRALYAKLSPAVPDVNVIRHGSSGVSSTCGGTSPS